MKKSLVPLSFGTFGLGIAEFVMMSILPQVAATYGVSIPQAGHLISAYALGVCVGAPLTVFVARNFPLKNTLFGLIAIYAAGNFLTAFSPTYWVIMLMRFIAGLPHGAFFGVGAITAEKIADKGKTAQALAVMISGMTVANLLGVPLGTFLTNLFSWRVIFALTGIWGVMNMVALYFWLPDMGSLPKQNLKSQFQFLSQPSPWIIVAITAFANGGIFCIYSFISPLMTMESGFSTADMSWIMVLCGLAMVAGNLLGGKLSDRFAIPDVLISVYVVAVLSMLGIFFFAHNAVLCLSFMVIASACLFTMSAPVQFLILQHSRGGEMMGAAMLQIAFNFGNAVGAWNGGQAINLWHGYNYPALIGAGFLATSLLLVLLLAYSQKRRPATCSA